MQNIPEEVVKDREVCFQEPHPEPSQADSALEFLQGHDGVLAMEAISQLCLRVRYDVRIVTLRDIECGLNAVGFHLEQSLFVKLRRALWYYAEDTQRANMGCEKGNSNCTTRVFVNRYISRDHGCRDERSRYWRKYW